MPPLQAEQVELAICSPKRAHEGGRGKGTSNRFELATTEDAESLEAGSYATSKNTRT